METVIHIPSLIISKIPLWFDVLDESLQSVEFSGWPKYGPTQLQGAALFILDFGYPIDAATLHAHKIRNAPIGPYVYVQGVDEHGRIRQTMAIPNGKIKRIGLRLWNAQTELILEDLVFRSHGGTLTSVHAWSDTLIQGDVHDTFPTIPPHAASVGVNLLTHHTGCGLTCHTVSSHWFRTMDQFQKRHPGSDAGRTNGYCECEGAGALPIITPITVFHSMPAILKIPSTIECYFQRIGDKSRNMVRKAKRLGYRYQSVDPDQYLDDIVAIRTSDPIRRGKPIPEYFYIKPRQALNAHFKSASCEYHGEEFYGVFKDNTLVAYATLFLYGQLAQVNHILGHKDHLKDGVMNLLVFEIVRSLLQKKPWVKAINYLYPDLKGTSVSIGMFKKSVGFEPMAVIVTTSEQDLTARFDRETRKVDAAPHAQPETAAPTRDAATHKKLFRDTAPLLTTGAKASKEEAMDALVRALETETGLPPTILTYSSTSGSFDIPIHERDVSILVRVGNLTVENYIDFLSAGMKQLTDHLPAGTYVVIDFLRTAGAQMLRSSANNGVESPSLTDGGRTFHVLEYVRKRFKDTDISVEKIRNGFKGSDVLITACVDYPCSATEIGFDSLVLMKKVR